MSSTGENSDLFSLIMSSWGSGGPETRKSMVSAFCQNDHFTLKLGLPRNSQYVDFACNSDQDTLLHLAVRRENEKSVQMLLRIGADPNARNKIGRTPLHEAAIVGNLKILQLLVENGGDLRLHDAYHYTPRQMTVALTKEKKLDIAYYIEVMRFLSTCYNSYDTEVMVSHRKFKGLKNTRNIRAPSTPLPEINCLGFGVFCTEKDRTSLISCIPFIKETELSMEFNRYPYINGPFTVMNTMTLDKSAVTVRRLRHIHNPTGVDLLINECCNMRRLRHPGLLYLMAVFNTTRLDSIGLVYEHIAVGSLFLSIHVKNKIYPPKKIACILCQICEALMYIHKQNLVHNYISSHAIQMVTEETPKLTNFEYMNYANDCPSNWLILREERSHKDSAWRWSSPELLMERIPSFKSDLFSLCCIIWEIYERAIPWKEFNLRETVACYEKGKTLSLTSPDVMKGLAMQVTAGLNANEQIRSVDLKNLRMALVKESVKTFVERGTNTMDLMQEKLDNGEEKTEEMPPVLDSMNNDQIQTNKDDEKKSVKEMCDQNATTSDCAPKTENTRDDGDTAQEPSSIPKRKTTGCIGELIKIFESLCYLFKFIYNCSISAYPSRHFIVALSPLFSGRW